MFQPKEIRTPLIAILERKRNWIRWTLREKEYNLRTWGDSGGIGKSEKWKRLKTVVDINRLDKRSSLTNLRKFKSELNSLQTNKSYAYKRTNRTIYEHGYTEAGGRLICSGNWVRNVFFPSKSILVFYHKRIWRGS